MLERLVHAAYCAETMRFQCLNSFLCPIVAYENHQPHAELDVGLLAAEAAKLIRDRRTEFCANGPINQQLCLSQLACPAWRMSQAVGGPVA